MSGYVNATSSLIDIVTILGLSNSPSEVRLNGTVLQENDEWKWHNDTMVKQPWC